MVESSICIIIGSAMGDIILPIVSGFFGASEAWPQSAAVESPDCAQQRSPPASVSLIKQGRPDLLMPTFSNVDMHEMSNRTTASKKPPAGMNDVCWRAAAGSGEFLKVAASDSETASHCLQSLRFF